MNKEFTPWFPAGCKPVRPGVYQVKGPYPPTEHEEDRYSRWTGKAWMLRSFYFERAARKKTQSIFQSPIWRGLAEKP